VAVAACGNSFTVAVTVCVTVCPRCTQVLTAQADHYFNSNQSELAASTYAKTKTHSFEQVTLKLLALGEKDAVKRYLSDKLDHMRSTDRAQLTMVCSWLTEMYLHQLNAASGIIVGLFCLYSRSLLH
jgi:hypothetical protein